jgi:hypothetical protein
MLSITYLKKFNRSIYWNLLDSAGSQVLLIIHHVFLRLYAGPELHGAFGAMLSLFYLVLIIINFGLDYSLAPFFKAFTKNKKSAQLMFFNYLIPQVILLVICSLIFYNFHPALFSLFSSTIAIKSHITKHIAQVISITFISESIRKTIKLLLQLSFKNKVTACVEFFGMLAHLVTIWLAFFIGFPISLNLCWSVLLIQSIVQVTILSIAALNKYLSLSSCSNNFDDDSNNLHLRFWKSRLFTFTNQILGQLFSGNFLVPLCAFYLGLEQASFLKVITSITYWITLVAQKVFGVSSSAILANAKNTNTQEQKSLFLYLSYYFHQALCSLVIFLLINGKKIVLLHNLNISPSFLSWSTLYLMLLISFSESFFTIYEKWYIIKEKIAYLFAFNFLSFSALYLILNQTSICYTNLSQISFFILIISVRMSMLLVLTLFSYHQWQIWPSFKINAKILISSLLLSLLFYFLI